MRVGPKADEMPRLKGWFEVARKQRILGYGCGSTELEGPNWREEAEKRMRAGSRPGLVAAYHKFWRFKDLVDRWHLETGGFSNPHSIVGHPLYREIVGLGWDGVFYILNEIDTNGPDFWGPALKEITGYDVPMPDEASGDISAACKAWVQALKDRGWST